MTVQVELVAEVWRWPGEAAWFFVTLPLDVAEEIRARCEPGRGFGSVRVSATVGATTWSTSVFPDSGTGSYLLPVKAAVRRAEGIAVGDRVRVGLRTLA